MRISKNIVGYWFGSWGYYFYLYFIGYNLGLWFYFYFKKLGNIRFIFREKEKYFCRLRVKIKGFKCYFS